MNQARALLLAIAVALAGFGFSERRAPCQETEASRPVDQALLAFLSRARSAHHIADQAEAERDLQRAARALSSVVDGALPHQEANGPEVTEVLADTLARLADFESQLGDYDAAAGHVARGLERLSPTPTYFRGHLYEVSGLIEERRAQSLESRGDKEGAAQAKNKALDALETAMKVQASVIEASRPAHP